MPQLSTAALLIRDALRVCPAWGKGVLYWIEFLKMILDEKPLATIHISFVPKTYLYNAPLVTNRSLVTGGFKEKNPKLWGSFVQNFIYGHFQHPQWDAHNVFLNLICTVWKDCNFIWDVEVPLGFNSAVLLFRTDGVPLSRQRLQGPLSKKNAVYIQVWSYGVIKPSSSIEIASEDNPNDKLRHVKIKNANRET